jgi:hypothetical protein
MSLPAHEIVYNATLPPSGVEIKFMQLLTIKDSKELIITADAFLTDFASYLLSLHEMVDSFAYMKTITTG